MSSFTRAAWVGLALLAAGGAVLACSEDAPDELSRSGDDDDGAGAGADGGGIAPSGGSVRAPYQVKTSIELASAVEACFGSGLTTVSQSMIQDADNPAGFLAARQFSEGADVIAGESVIIDGDPSVERVGVRNSALSLPILAALQDIGNVVGENCAAQRTSNAKCDCTTAQGAREMLARCLPSIAPSKYAALEATFAEACAKDTATAIASLLASTAFGVQ
ncbi:MAG: hypothetical protein U0270_28765 [Labilithrix sp.]